MTAPAVTVVIAARNEEGTVAGLLNSLATQDFTGKFEVIIADGMSTDRTRQVVADWCADQRLAVRVIDNPRQITASGLNAGIAASTSDIVIILGAHAEVEPDFVSASVRALIESGASCAGGLLHTVGRGPTGRAVAGAMTSPIGVGNAFFRTGAASARDVDTVAFGAYRREVFERIGGFDEAIVSAEDGELNFRLRLSGDRIRFDPAIRSTYYCRDSFKGVAIQYFRYGRGKCWVMKKHHRLPSARVLVPSALVTGLVGASVLALLFRRPLLAGAPMAAYGVGAGVGAAVIARDTRASWWRVLVALAAMHLSYGTGMFAGLLPRSTARQPTNGTLPATGQPIVR